MAEQKDFDIIKTDDWTLKLKFDTKNKRLLKFIDFLYEHYTYEVEQNKEMKRKKFGYVPVKRMFHKQGYKMPCKLVWDLIKLLKANGFTFNVDPELVQHNDKEWVENAYNNFLKDDFKGHFHPHPHQEKAIKSFLYRKNLFCTIATSGGKSFIIYALAGIFLREQLKAKDKDKPLKKVLIITDSVTLVEQLKSDFLSYTKKEKFWKDKIKAIHGKSKDSKYDESGLIFISTYASMKEDDEYFKQFDCVIIDEGHKATTPSITAILEKCWHAQYIFGMTGSLPSNKESRLNTLKLFSDILPIIKAKELIENGQATPVNIEIVTLKHTFRPTFDEYADFQSYYANDKKRLEFVANDLISKNTNTIALFIRRAYGTKLYEEIKRQVNEKGLNINVEYVDGEVSADERIRIKDMFADGENTIVVASYKTMATGVNAPNLRVLALAQPMKAEVSLIQALGRTIRNCKGKDKAYILDYVDSYGWGYRHGQERVKLYKSEGHNWTRRSEII